MYDITCEAEVRFEADDGKDSAAQAIGRRGSDGSHQNRAPGSNRYRRLSRSIGITTMGGRQEPVTMLKHYAHAIDDRTGTDALSRAKINIKTPSSTRNHQ